MPGSNKRALDKSRGLAADCIIMDLEDAVASDSKIAARSMVIKEIKRGGYGHREIVVRVNGLATMWGCDDVAAVACSGADAVLLPKVDGAEQLRDLQRLLLQHGAPSEMDVWCLIETPLGVINAAEICRELSQSHKLGGNALTTLCMGFGDLGTELHAPQVRGRHNFVTSAQLCLLAARAYGLRILDGVHQNLVRPHMALSCSAGLTSICPTTTSKLNW